MKAIYRTLPNLLMWGLPLLLIVPNIALDFTEQYYSAWARLANALLPFGVYLLLMAWSRLAGRTALFLLPVMVLCAFQIVLLYLYGESIIAIDMFLNVVTTNVHEATELLRNLVAAIITVCVLYLPPIAVAIFCLVKRLDTSAAQRRSARWTGLSLAVIGAVCFGAAFASPDGYKPERELFPLNVFYNMAVATERTAQAKEFKYNKPEFTFNARATHPDSISEIYVLVVGETSRADNWQLNGYDRHTNPRLSARRCIVSFDKALSESNTTHKSVPLLLSHLDSSAFGDSIYHVHSILDAFNEAGFQTAWISNQQRNGALIDYFGEEADSALFINDDGRPHYDSELAPHLANIIAHASNKKLFVVLHTYGSHFNYTERYPEQEAVFTPAAHMQAQRKHRSELMNAYDNTIVAVDALLDSVATILDQTGRPAAMLYLADHGEDIFDDSRNRFLHASPTPTYWQIHVPMILWVSEAYEQAYPRVLASARANSNADVSSSRSAFPTMLSLAGVETPFCDHRAALTSPRYTTPERKYLNDYNEAVPFGRAGLRRQDFECLDSAEIAIH